MNKKIIGLLVCMLLISTVPIANSIKLKKYTTENENQTSITWPPSGWNEVLYGGNGHWEERAVDDSNRDPYGASGSYAIADSDLHNENIFNVGLQSPLFDLSDAQGTVTLECGISFEKYIDDQACIRVYSDAGLEEVLRCFEGNYKELFSTQLNYNEYISKNGIKIEFYYYTEEWSWFFAVDNVIVEDANTIYLNEDFEEDDIETLDILITFPGDGMVFNEALLEVSAILVDNTGLTEWGYTHTWDGGSTSQSYDIDGSLEYDVTFDITLHLGENGILVYAKDNKGNIDMDTVTVTYQLPDTNPPEIEIMTPKNAIYLNNKELIPFPIPIIFGPIDIQVDAQDEESGVEKVDFYVDGIIQCGDTLSPYHMMWGEKCFGMKTIRIEAYDKEGNIAEKEITALVISGTDFIMDEIPQPVMIYPEQGQAVGGIVRLCAVEASDRSDIKNCRFSWYSGDEWIEIDTDSGYFIDDEQRSDNFISYWFTEQLPSTGYYTIKTEIESYEGYIGVETNDLLVTKDPEINVETVSYDPETNTRVFTAEESYDPDGSISDYEWTFWTYPDTVNMTGGTVEFSAPENYLEYTFTITVTDNQGVSSNQVYWSVDDDVTEEFSIETSEIYRKMDRMYFIRLAVGNIRTDLIEEDNTHSAINDLYSATQYIGWAKDKFEQAQQKLIEAQELEEPADKNALISEAMDLIDQAEQDLLEAINKLADAIGKLTGYQEFQDDLLSYLQGLQEIRIECWMINAKLWLLQETGVSGHGADIPFPGITISGSGSFYRPGVEDSEHPDRSTPPTINVATDDVDDEDVFLHEFDHHLMHEKDNVILEGGTHGYNQHLTGEPKTEGGPNRTRAEAERCAFSEGWAHFSSCAKRNSSIFTDANDYEFNLENRSWRYYNTTTHQWSPWYDTSIYPDGKDIEASIAAILWDLFDKKSGYDRVELPFNCIWKALNRASDPNKEDGSEDPATNITEFAQHLEYVLKNDPDCQKTGNELRDLFRDLKTIFQSHGCPYNFTP